MNIEDMKEIKGCMISAEERVKELYIFFEGLRIHHEGAYQKMSMTLCDLQNCIGLTKDIVIGELKK